MCCGGAGATTKESIPKWLESAGKDVWGKAKSFYETPYQEYGGPRQAGLSTDQLNSFQALRDYVAGGGSQALANEGTGMVRSGAAAPWAQVGTERVVDEGGRLGAMSDYMNPYIAGALQPGLRAIDEGAAQNRKRLSGMATGAGAFGDARQGILESQIGRDQLMSRGDLANKAYADAWDKAFGMRSDDLGRMLGAETTQANLYETALNRLMSGGEFTAGQATQQQTDLMSRLDALLKSGTAQQQQAQTGLDIPYGDYQKRQQDAYDRLAALTGVIGRVPYSRTTTQDDGGSGLLNAIGSGVGALFGGGI